MPILLETRVSPELFLETLAEHEKHLPSQQFDEMEVPQSLKWALKIMDKNSASRPSPWRVQIQGMSFSVEWRGDPLSWEHRDRSPSHLWATGRVERDSGKTKLIVEIRLSRKGIVWSAIAGCILPPVVIIAAASLPTGDRGPSLALFVAFMSLVVWARYQWRRRQFRDFILARVRIAERKLLKTG